MAHGEHGALHPAGPKGFHILGFDIIFEENYRPKLLELNANSSMSVLQAAAEPSETGAKTEVSELDLAIKSELISQALLLVNPLRHRLALQGRIAWLEETGGSRRIPMGMTPSVDEAIPLDDDGRPVESGTNLIPRPDRPDKCPALCPLDFERQPAFSYVQNHLQAYRIWRHFSFNPPGSCALREGQTSRRYLGFGRQQFRQLCETTALFATSPRRLGERGFLEGIAAPCWEDRAAAEVFWSRCMSDEMQAPMDFPRFLRRLAMPVGEALMREDSGMTDPLEAFVARVLFCASQSIGLSPRGRPHSDDEEGCEDSR
jgi:hypothetical protein